MHEEPKLALKGVKIEEIEYNPGKVYNIAKSDQVLAQYAPQTKVQKVHGSSNKFLSIKAEPQMANHESSQIFDMTAAPENDETGVKKLDKLIEQEMDKADPNMNRLIQNFRQRRLTIQKEEAKKTKEDKQEKCQ